MWRAEHALGRRAGVRFRVKPKGALDLLSLGHGRGLPFVCVLLETKEPFSGASPTRATTEALRRCGQRVRRTCDNKRESERLAGRRETTNEKGMKAGSISVFSVPGMDCPTEAGLVRMTLGEVPEVESVDIDLKRRRVEVRHLGDSAEVGTRLAALGFGAELVTVSAAVSQGPGPAIDISGERRTLKVVLAINAVMFVVELVAGWLANSTGLLADSLDMLADALVYAVGLKVVGGSIRAQHRAARLAGVLQLAMGLGVLVEVARRALMGSEPTSVIMMVTAGGALAANLVCARLLQGHREGGAHMRASWIFTATDAIANLGVVLAGGLVFVTGSGLPDLVIGTVIASVVLYGAVRIVRIPRTEAAAAD